MNRIFGILAGVGVGLGLMYIMDPERGARRRALIRDKAIGMKNDLTQMAEKNVTHMRNKAQGLLHEAKTTFSNGETENTGSESGQTA
jgi:hypothetical protein